jgi:hypothetical protein
MLVGARRAISFLAAAGPLRKAFSMSTEIYAVRFRDVENATVCPNCGAQQADTRGPRLFRAGHDEPLCRDCGKRAAPALGALLELAGTAERVGRPCRHLLTPPMEALLDLARAAENYATTTLPIRAAAG